MGRSSWNVSQPSTACPRTRACLSCPPWKNMFLIAADLLSLGLHFMILYVPFMAALFQLQPLDMEEWKWVLIFSVPVLLLDEVLKFVSRMTDKTARSSKPKTD